MSHVRETILECLADHQRHSGSALASGLGITRAAVGRHVARLRACGWAIDGRAGSGYRLRGPGSPLRRSCFEEELHAVAERVANIELLATVGSTSDYLARCDPPADGSAHICIAECQTAGRGRRGRSWLAPAGGAVTLSVARSLPLAPADAVSLGLAVGVAVTDTLASLQATDIGLKWPNDMVVNGAKLGGILIDVAGESAGPTRAVVGIGLNYALPAAAVTGLGREVTDLHRACRQPPPGRDIVAGRVAAAIVQGCDRFVADGFAAFRERWAACDVLTGHPVAVETVPGQVIHGGAAGVDGDGALLVDTAAGRRRFMAGDVSVRPRP